MQRRIVEFNKVRDLNKFINKIVELGYTIEYGPHIVLEDHSEISVFKVYRENSLVAYIVSHYITQYYRAVLTSEQASDEEFLHRLLEIKYSGERWSIPVNPVYIMIFEDEFINKLVDYNDMYPIDDGESLVRDYQSRNKNYRNLPRVVLARLVE
ncbi:MAG: hypothetical protein QXE81_06025 [Desulfurococcaceae archaeon]